MTRSMHFVMTLLLTIFLALSLAAQNQGVDILLSKARSLESRGRMDLAAQNWQQVLLVSPNQTEALAGLARYAKQNGDAEEERGYLDRLKKINPKDPEIAEIEKMHVITPQERNRLDEAGRLAMQHKPDQAMRIYNEVFGNQPPSGKWAEPYYETEAASTGGRENAIAQLRRLCAHDPGNETYRLWLARVLVYNPKTRMEGLHFLESLHDPGAVEQARSQWRQALLWEKENPTALSSVNAYLERYPDQELQGMQKTLQAKQEHADEEASKARGFQALRSKDMSTAEAKFLDVLEHNPNDPNAVAGLAFVRLNQKRFDEAVTLFEKARTLAPKRADLRDGYDTAKFWSLIEQGSSAFERNDSDAAIGAYQRALALRPNDTQAMLGIAQARVHQKRLPEAETQFQQVLNQSPNNTDAIAGLAFLKLDEKKFDDAVGLFDKARKLVPNRPDLDQAYKDAKFWSLMQQAAMAIDQNNSAAAISDYQQALALRPNATDALQGMAGAAERGRNLSQALEAYNMLAAANPADAKNWIGLMRLEMASKNYKQALELAQRVPPSLKPQLEARADYLASLALAYYNTGQQQAGDLMLRRAMNLASGTDSTEALNTRLETAGLLMDQGKVNSALEIYQQATRLHPENTLAWKAVIGAYTQQRDFTRAKAAVSAMPRGVYQEASKNSDFLNSVAAIYSANGECTQAEDMLNRSLSLDRAAGREPAENTQLELADIWLREQNYHKARQAYRGILGKNQSSLDAWRGYLTALHNDNADRDLVSEVQHIPVPVRNELDKDPHFLTLLAGAQSKLGQYKATVQLLERARDLYQAHNQISPAEVDMQLAWAMLNDRQTDPRLFLSRVKARKDLTRAQRAAIDEIWGDWVVRAAEEAVQAKKPEQAIGILNDAERDLSNDPRIYAALALIYVKQHKNHEALSVYRSWNMEGAEAGDYRAAAGTAIALHNNDLANSYLREGLQRFPNDPGLLEMQGKQSIAHGDYKEGQAYLQQALWAARKSETSRQNFVEQSSDRTNVSSPPPAALETSNGTLSVGNTATEKMPACRRTSSYKVSRFFHARLMNASLDQQDQTGRTQNNQAENPDPAQASSPQAPSTANPDHTNQDQTGPNPNNTNQQDGLNSNNQNTAANTQSNPDQQQIQDEIDVVQNRNTPFADIASAASGRAGDSGIDRLIVEEGTVGGSVTSLDKVRFSTYAKGLYLFSGTPNGQSKFRFGTLPPGATFGEQTTGGITGELQLSTATFGLDFSATPQGFPVQNFLGGIRFRPLGGPFTFLAVRDSVKDSMLSYAGVRDPGTGIVWGGVVSNTGTLQLDHKTRRCGQYAAVSFSYLTGKNVPNNWNASGNAGFYFVVAKNLSVGLSVSGMHYDQNLSFFSLGQGGYFSPQQYGLAAIPISWFSRHKRFEYEIRASLGAQYIAQDASPFFPSQVAGSLSTQGVYAATNSTGANYYFLGRLGYRLAPHLYLDTFATANNARNYATQTVGFSIKILAHRLPTNTDLHVNSVPDWKGNQPFGIE